MSKMNYNRPNGGYEREPWQKPQASTKSYWQGYSNNNPNFLKHRDHQSTVRPHKTHVAELYCIECNKHIQWLSKDQYRIFKTIQNMP